MLRSSIIASYYYCRALLPTDFPLRVLLEDALSESEAILSLRLQTGIMLPDPIGVLIDETPEESPLNEASMSLVSSDDVECCIQECPEFLHHELMLLFPSVSLSTGELRIITLCERTENDMTGWSQAVEEEREDLLDHVRH